MGMAVFKLNSYLQKQVAGWFWPVGHSSPTPDLVDPDLKGSENYKLYRLVKSLQTRIFDFCITSTLLNFLSYTSTCVAIGHSQEIELEMDSE